MAYEECRHVDVMPLPGGRELVSRCFRRKGHDDHHAMPVARAVLRWVNDGPGEAKGGE